MGEQSDSSGAGLWVALLSLVVAIATLGFTLYASKEARMSCDFVGVACLRSNAVKIYSIEQSPGAPVVGVDGLSSPWLSFAYHWLEFDGDCLPADNFPEGDNADKVVSDFDKEHWEISKVADSMSPNAGTTKLATGRQLVFLLDSRHRPPPSESSLDVSVTTYKQGYMIASPETHSITQSKDARTRVVCPISYSLPGDVEFEFQVSEYLILKDDPVKVRVNIAPQ